MDDRDIGNSKNDRNHRLVDLVTSANRAKAENDRLVDLVNRAKGEGDAESDHATDRLSEFCFDLCRRLARDPRHAVPPDEAEDLAQEASLKFIRTLDLYDQAKGTVPGWIATIWHSKRMDFGRAKRSKDRWHSTFSIDASSAAEGAAVYELPGREEAAEELALRDELTALVHAALRELPAEDRQLLILRYLEDLDCDTIADMIGWTARRVHQRLHAIRCSLRENPGPFRPMDPNTYRHKERKKRGRAAPEALPQAEPDAERELEEAALDQEQEGCGLDELPADQSPVIVCDAPDVPDPPL